MYAIIDAAGFQVKVAPGDTIKVQKLATSGDMSVTFDRVLLVSKDEETMIGSPYVKGATVSAEILGDDKAGKVLIFKKKPRKGHKKLRGHRQPYSLVKIQDIVVGG